MVSDAKFNRQSVKTVSILKALADPTRLAIVRQLRSCHAATESCGQLSAKSLLSQPTLSHHFNKLVEAGVVKEKKHVTSKYYSLNQPLLQNLGINADKL